MEKSGTYISIFSALKRWGNSQAVRIPNDFLQMLNLKENDKIKLSIHDQSILIEKAEDREYSSELKERLEAFYHRPLDEIYVESTKEVDTGAPVGNEIW